MDTQDYRVQPLTVEQIESRTEFLRKKWGIANRTRIDVFELLFDKMPQDLVDSGLRMIARAAGYMGLRDAYATSRPKKIFYRERLFAQLRLGDERASVTFLHELGHIILHLGAPKAWMTAGNASYAYIEEERSAEWQATMFALCFKAPMRLARDCNSAEDLAKKFGLSDADAGIRFEIIRRRRPRKLNCGISANQTVRPADQIDSKGKQCPVCGTCELSSFGAKDFCKNCGTYGDKFQDGDAFGFEF